MFSRPHLEHITSSGVKSDPGLLGINATPDVKWLMHLNIAPQLQYVRAVLQLRKHLNFPVLLISHLLWIVPLKPKYFWLTTYLFISACYQCFTEHDQENWCKHGREEEKEEAVVDEAYHMHMQWPVSIVITRVYYEQTACHPLVDIYLQLHYIGLLSDCLSSVFQVTLLCFFQANLPN